MSPVLTVPELHHVHRRANRHPHRRLGQPERFDHLPLTLGRAAIVRAHRGKQKRPRSALAEPIAGRLGDRRDVGNAAAAGRDADVALRNFEIQPIERRMHRRGNIRNRIRNQFLTDAKEFHLHSVVCWKHHYRPASTRSQSGPRFFAALAGVAIRLSLRQPPPPLPPARITAMEILVVALAALATLLIPLVILMAEGAVLAVSGAVELVGLGAGSVGDRLPRCGPRVTASQASAFHSGCPLDEVDRVSLRRTGGGDHRRDARAQFPVLRLVRPPGPRRGRKAERHRASPSPQPTAICSWAASISPMPNSSAPATMSPISTSPSPT